MKPSQQDLMAMSEQALVSSRMLLDVGDTNGACNRAYYAMFDAARAVLLALGVVPYKTHRGVINAFNEHLVKSKRLPREVELGRHLRNAEMRRLVADYSGDPIELSDAQEVVKQADIFVSAIKAHLVEGGLP